jgi:hypothetical protein
MCVFVVWVVEMWRCVVVVWRFVIGREDRGDREVAAAVAGC